MAGRERGVHNKLNPTCKFIELSPLNHFFFRNGCLSGPYLGMYKRDWNETWFI